MRPGLGQHTQLKQELKINPRLYQAMDLLYMPLLDLHAHLQQELLQGPGHALFDVRRQRFLRSLSQYMLDPSLRWLGTLDWQYHDQSHFVRDFRRFMGMSPSAYAKLDKPLLTAAAVALAIVGSRPTPDLQLAIMAQDQAVLVSIPGIGKKLAERIIFELKEKVAAADGLAFVAPIFWMNFPAIAWPSRPAPISASKSLGSEASVRT